ncbi:MULTISPECIES: hypothetical protein [unclassified Streptomyces]|uniref:hypothetical protein n=1 Tax=unclassified Streptomyces TaxID=2593676 RepID=UPI002E823483|nr:hypothetical protein [Streptomyces sp. NBC_00589]WTI37424.1 hypothetical protein OIC96_21610 [Streptomyces sp. NBC_00775]WUB28899.1 hypothetical protein OHA51_28125 [Streptomyces sp. NBC_00589]
MSIHLMVVAAYLPEDVVTQSQKLAMMKICDSADDETRLSKPGLRRLRAWVGVGEKRCMTIVTDLVAKGLIERVETGKSGRRAVYRVFPMGVPPIPSNDDLEARFKEADAAPKNPRLARPGVTRAAPSKPAMTHQDLDARALAAGEGVERAGFPRGNPEESGVRVPPGEPSGFPEGNPLGSPGGTPSFPSSSSVLPSPLTPATDAAGEPAGCARHRVPAASCRACGTSPRAARAASERDRGEAERQAQQDWLRGYQAELDQARRVAQERPEDVEAARLLARQMARQGREKARYCESPEKNS